MTRRSGALPAGVDPSEAQRVKPMDGEQELIERIRKALPSGGRAGPSHRSANLLLGIGDDAAVFRFPAAVSGQARGTDWVVSCDWFLEGVHFLARMHSPDSAGYKSLARATSDLAAMGATPRFFLLSLALPQRRTGIWLDKFLVGMARAARSFGMVLAGGDTSKSTAVAVNITVLGQIAPGHAIPRSGARLGDQIYVSGTLGRAQLGLELILRGLSRRRNFLPLLQAHLYPQPRVSLGNWLARRGAASAMIDLSDGLSTDLSRLCEASRVGARVWAKRIPRVRVPPTLGTRGFDPGRLALHGGEDYELLFTVPPDRARRIPHALGGVRLTRIGEIVRGPGVALIGREGDSRRLEPRGWDPFKGKSRSR